jgi:hypothetical protein
MIPARWVVNRMQRFSDDFATGSLHKPTRPGAPPDITNPLLTRDFARMSGTGTAPARLSCDADPAAACVRRGPAKIGNRNYRLLCENLRRWTSSRSSAAVRENDNDPADSGHGESPVEMTWVPGVASRWPTGWSSWSVPGR